MLRTPSHAVSKSAARLAAAVLILASSAAAQTWTQIATPVLPRELITDPVDADHLLITDINQSEYHETFDGGATWSVLAVPTLPTGVFRGQFSIDNGGHVVMSVCRYLNASPLAGPLNLMRVSGTWQPIGPDVAPQVFPICGTPPVRGRLDPQRLAFSGAQWDGFTEHHQVFLSDDGGSTWTSTPQGTGPIDIVEGAGEPYLIGSSQSANPYPWTSIWRSVGFAAPTQSLTGGEELEFEVAPAFPTKFWALTGDLGSQTFLRSYDGGATWDVIANFDGTERLIRLQVHPTRPGFAAAYRVTGEMVTTTDGGLSFTPAGVAYFPHSFVEDGQVLYATRSVSNGFEILRTELFPTVGSQECSAQVNGSGSAATIAALGSTSLGLNGLSLQSNDVTQNAFGYFICSENAGFVAQPGGSFGDLCLSGSIGRFGELLQNSGGYGQLFGEVDLSSLPSPTGSVVGQVGQTWRFQAWFRDNQGGATGSNFSAAVAVTLTP